MYLTLNNLQQLICHKTQTIKRAKPKFPKKKTIWHGPHQKRENNLENIIGKFF